MNGDVGTKHQITEHLAGWSIWNAWFSLWITNLPN